MNLQTVRKNWLKKADAFLFWKPESLDDKSLVYLTGFWGSTGVFVQTRSKNFLIVDGRYQERARSEVEKNITIVDLPSGQTFPLFLKEFLKKLKIKKVAIDGRLNLNFFEDLKKANRGVKFFVDDESVNKARLTKTEEEIKIIHQAQRLTDELFEWLLDQLKPGKQTEKEIAFEIERWACAKDLSGLSFDPIIAGAAHSARPHHLPTSKKIPTKGVLLFDFGIRFRGYCSDCTRTIWIGNKPSQEFIQAYETVLQAQEAAISACAFTGEKKAKEIDATARNIIDNSKFKGTFTHGTGHGLGLDIHESPSLKQTSKDVLYGNEIVTIEPGVYLPKKFGIRIEDVVVAGSGKNLTKAEKKLIVF